MSNSKHKEAFTKFLAWEAISRDHIDVKAIYIDIADGDHAAGIFLSQLVYWYLIPGKNGKSKLRVHRDGEWWIAKGRDEWYEEIRLRPRQFDRVATMLKKIGIIETKTYKFAGVPRTHVRIVVDRFMEVWGKFAEVDTDDLFPTSPDREVHIQRLLIKDKKKEKETHKEEEKDDTKPAKQAGKTCDKCNRTDKWAVKLSADIDPLERCAWCFVLDGWTHTMAHETMHKKKGVPKRGGTDSSNVLRKKAATRMKDDTFARTWVFAMNKAARMKHLMNAGWFTLAWFIRNDENIIKIIGDDGADGVFDSFEQQRHPQSYAALLAWLAASKAGKQTVASTGWAQI